MENKIKKNLEQAFKPFRQQQLNGEEKKVMSDKLLAFVEENEVQEKNSRRIFFPLIIFKPLLATFTLLVLVVGTAFASQSSLPGDLLYPVKLFISEDVQPLFMNEEEKTSHKFNQIDHRLVEAEELLAKEKLSDKRKLIVEKQLEKSIDKILKNKNEEKVQKLEKILERHENVLEYIEIDKNFGGFLKKNLEKELINTPIDSPVEEVPKLENQKIEKIPMVPVVEPVENITELIIEPVEPIVEPIVEPVSEEIVEEAAELVEEVVEEPVEVINETVVEPVEPVTEEVIEEVIEVVEPVEEVLDLDGLF